MAKVQKIAEFIAPRMVASLQARLERLRQLDAPAIIIQAAEIAVENPLAGIGKIKEFGDLEYVEAQPKTYRRGEGVEFTLPDGSHVWLIPGPYGLFLTDEAR